MTPTEGGEQVIEAEVPMAEMTSYAIDLRAMTQSRGSYVFHFVRYEDCPPAAQEKAIAAAKADPAVAAALEGKQGNQEAAPAEDAANA